MSMEPWTKSCISFELPAVFPMGPWLSFPLCGVPLTGVPAPMYGAVASVLLQLPYFKHVFAFMGCRPAGEPGIHLQIASWYSADSAGSAPAGQWGV